MKGELWRLLPGRPEVAEPVDPGGTLSSCGGVHPRRTEESSSLAAGASSRSMAVPMAANDRILSGWVSFSAPTARVMSAEPEATACQARWKALDADAQAFSTFTIGTPSRPVWWRADCPRIISWHWRIPPTALANATKPTSAGVTCASARASWTASSARERTLRSKNFPNRVMPAPMTTTSPMVLLSHRTCLLGRQTVPGTRSDPPFLEFRVADPLGAGLEDLPDELHVPGDRVAGHLALTVGDERLGRQVLARLRDDDQLHLVLSELRRHGVRGALLHLGMRVHHALDLPRRDVLAEPADRFLLASPVVVEAVRVLVRQVAGVEPPPPVGILRGVGEPVVVRQLAPGVAEDQLTDLAGRDGLPGIVEEGELDPGHGLADGAHLADVVEEDAGGVHHAEPLDEPDPEPLLELLPPVGGAASGEDDPDGVVGIVRARRLLEQDRYHPAQRVELHGLEAAAVVEEPRCAEPLPKGKSCVEQHGADHRHEEGVAVEKGKRCVHRLAGLDPGGFEQHTDRAGVVAVGHDTFRGAGGPRRVQHRRSARRLADLDHRLPVRGRQEPLHVPIDAVPAGAPDDDGVCQVRTAVARRLKGRPQVLGEDRCAYAGVRQDVSKGGPPLGGVHRDRPGADEEQAEVGPDELRAVVEQDGDPVTGAHPELEPAVRRPLGVAQHGGPREPLILPGEPLRLGMSAGALANQQLDQIGRAH